MTNYQLLKRAIVSAEDHRFYSHVGIDPIAILRALWVDIKARRYAEGGSTITQQLARTLYLTPEKKISRKVIEVFLAFYLESKYLKSEILDLYIREVYLGHRPDGSRIKGFFEACRFYYGTELEDAGITEVTALVAALKAPNLYRPGTVLGLKRQAIVLEKLNA